MDESAGSGAKVLSGILTVRPDDPEAGISRDGDSGTLVIDSDGRIVGILIGGRDDSDVDGVIRIAEGFVMPFPRVQRLLADYFKRVIETAAPSTESR